MNDYQCSNSEVLETIKRASEDTPLIIDFDETLFLRNSTEEYLNSLQPRILGAILLLILSAIKPWNYLPNSIRGDLSRDWVRVVVATLFFPWTPLFWQLKAKKLAQSYINTELTVALQQKAYTRLIIATQGFYFIVNPILNHLSIPIEKKIACRFWQGSIDRNQGKLWLINKAFDEKILENAILITDSIDDKDILTSVPYPCLTQWQDAEYRQAMSDIYIPFFYIEKVKQPGENYILKVILADDLLFLILACSWLSSQPIIHGFSLTLLIISFWCIYEVGYMENDLIAEKIEKKPKLSENYLKYKNRINLWIPWIWSILIALPGILLLQIANWDLMDLNYTNAIHYLVTKEFIFYLALWICLLIALRLSFWTYNYVNKPTRVWLYPILQSYKTFGFLAVTSSNIIGVMLFSSQVISRWILYLVYRYAQGRWQKVGQIIRFSLFTLLLIAVALGTHDLSLVLSWQSLTILAYCFLRGGREFLRESKQLGLIKQDEWG